MVGERSRRRDKDRASDRLGSRRHVCNTRSVQGPRFLAREVSRAGLNYVTDKAGAAPDHASPPRCMLTKNGMCDGHGLGPYPSFALPRE